MTVMRTALLWAGCTGFALAQGAAPGSAADSPIRPGHLSPFGRQINRALGDRLVKPGKERLILRGQLTFGGIGVAKDVQCTIELSGRLRLDGVSDNSVLIWDPIRSGADRSRLNGSDQWVVDSLLYDSVDQFLRDELSGMPRRKFPQSFRSVGAAANAPAYDVVQVVTSHSAPDKAPSLSKLYFFRSDTHLLERVRYRTAAGPVETAFSDWGVVEGQMVPRRVTRSENGVVVLELRVTGAGVAPKVSDSLFEGK